MISEHSRVVFTGKIVSVTLDDTCELTLWGLKMGSQPDTPTPKELIKLLNTLATEASEIRDRIEDITDAPKAEGLVQRALAPEPEPVLIYDDILALTSNHAREVAILRFNQEHPESVLNVRGTERIQHAMDELWLYRVLGFITPRQKKTAVKAEEPAGAK